MTINGKRTLQRLDLARADDDLPVLDDVAYGIDPQLVDQGSIALDVADKEIEAFADFQASDRGIPVDRVGRVGRAGVDRFTPRLTTREKAPIS